MNKFSDNIDRFNDRADNYDKFRPGYPQQLLTYIYEHNQLKEHDTVVEIGAGTGILSQELAKWPSRLIAIEPNDEMREKAINILSHAEHCTVVQSTAEHTGLANNSADLIICAQSFHWFDAAKCKIEFQRILRDHKKVAIIWNIRSAETAFEQAYEEFILQFSIDYKEVKKRELRGNNLHRFFNQGVFEKKIFIYDTYLTFEQLLGRTLSYSYMPNYGHKLLPAMVDALKTLFDKHSTNHIIGLSYKTKLFMGEL